MVMQTFLQKNVPKKEYCMCVCVTHGDREKESYISKEKAGERGRESNCGEDGNRTQVKKESAKPNKAATTKKSPHETRPKRRHAHEWRGKLCAVCTHKHTHIHTPIPTNARGFGVRSHSKGCGLRIFVCICTSRARFA